jgi:hypothetical protein
MINEQYKIHAEASYLCNVYTFIGTGEGRKLSPLEVMHIKQKYPTVHEWYATLDQAGRQRVDRFLAKVVISTWPPAVNKKPNRGDNNDRQTD